MPARGITDLQHGSGVESLKIKKENVADIVTLTPLQEGILYHYLKAPGSHLYFEQLCLDLSGEIEPRIIEEAWNDAAKNNEMLRACFRWGDLNQPFHIILKEHPVQFICRDWSGLPSQEQDPLLEELRRGDRNQPFDLQTVPFRVTLAVLGRRRCRMIVSSHHILYDGWSTGILLREFFYAYGQRLGGKLPSPLAKTPFKEFVKWVNREITHEKTFWQDYLKDLDSRTDITIKNRPTTVTGIENEEVEMCRLTLVRRQKERLEKGARDMQVTLAALFNSAWGLLLQKYAHKEDVVFGTTVSGRSAKIRDIENMVGVFINTLPFRVHTKSSNTVRQLLEQTHRSLQNMEPYHHTSLVNIKKYCGWDSRAEFFDSIVVMENYPLDDRELGGSTPFSIDSFHMSEMTHYDLTVGIVLCEDSIDIQVAFPAGLFERESIERLTVHFSNILVDMVGQPGKELAAVEMLSQDEKRQILEEFSHTGEGYPTGITVCELFENQVRQTPDAASVTVPPLHLTYRELNRRAGNAASRLKHMGVAANSIVAVILEPSVNMVVCLLAILKAGGAYLPIDPENPRERTDYMFKDSNTLWLVYDKKRNREWEREKIQAARVDIQSLMEPIVQESLPVLPPVTGTDLAYVIYTSGSTGRPKGVPISHANLAPLLLWSRGCFHFGVHTRVLQSLSYSFDFGAFELFTTLLFGGGYFPYDIKKMVCLEEYVDILNRCRINTVHTTPSFFNHIVGQGREMPTLRIVHLGGELLSGERVLELSFLVLPECRIFNGYGPTETTINASIFSLRAGDALELAGTPAVPIGKPSADNRVYILDIHRSPCPPGIPGELYIGGSGVACGYLNRPELTSERFIMSSATRTLFEKRVPDSQKLLSDELIKTLSPLYRTGDRVRWLPDGNIDFLGRLDQQVKIRGYRVELGEIENHLLGCKEIRDAVVIAKDDTQRGNYLCAYIVPAPGFSTGGSEQDPDPAALKEVLSETLPAYMIPSFFIFMEKIPLTSSGKVDRHALPEPCPAVRDLYIPPRNEIEKQLVEAWEMILDKPGEKEKRIGIDTDFFKQGGHSLNMFQLVSGIHKKLNVELPLTEIFQHPTPRSLAQSIRTFNRTRFRSIPAAEEKEYYPLSFAQERMFVLHRLDNKGIAYNMFQAMELDGELDRDRFTGTFSRLVRRHESFRTSFQLKGTRPVQRVHREVDFRVEFLPVEDSAPGAASARYYDAIFEDFLRPFDLSRPPLLRVGVRRLEAGRYILMVDMPHIISDAVSLGTVVREFMALYGGERLPGLTLRYRDYAQWQHSPAEQERLDSQEHFWLEQFQGEVPVLNLPADFAVPIAHSFDGGCVLFELAGEKKRALKTFASNCGTTLYTVLLSMTYLFLAKLSGQEDIVVGTPVSGRDHVDLESIVGFFVNTLALRFFPSGDKPFSRFLQEVISGTLGAFDRQDYPFDRLVHKLAIKHDAHRNPLFDVMFTLQKDDIADLRIPGLTLRPYYYHPGISKFHLVLIAVEDRQHLRMRMEYSRQRFEETTIRRFVRYYENIIDILLKEPGLKLRDVEIIPEDEKRRLLMDFNDTGDLYPADKSLHLLFEEQVERSPHAVALSGKRLQENRRPVNITFKELDDASNRLAGRLVEQGCRLGGLVGIMMERSIELIIGILAILKSGCGYVPVNPKEAPERAVYILDDCRAGLLLLQPSLTAENRFKKYRCIMVDDDGSIAVGGTGSNMPLAKIKGIETNEKDNIAYVVFTSGSTGKPKGVPITHGNICPLLHWGYREFGIAPTDRALQNVASYFDWSVWEIFIIITSGASLYIVNDDILMTADTCAGFITRYRVTVFHATPSQWQYLVQGKWRPNSLKCLFIGGEKLSCELVKQIFGVMGEECRMFNQYGPTEVTIMSTCLEIRRDRFQHYRQLSCMPIGGPLANLDVYILDLHLNVCPLNVAGELYIGGDGVAAGYLNQPELTAEKFSPSPVTRHPSPIYRTGDLARWLPDGNIEFLGRTDRQVKIRGLRIELGEIENRLLQHRHIKEAAVVFRLAKSGEPFLCAFIVPCTSSGGRELTQLRRYLSEKLPAYMIPSHFITLDRLPLTPNGKLDVQALPDIEEHDAGGHRSPTGPVEKELLDIWAEVLDVPAGEIRVEDDFFQLGGHSLKASVLTSLVHKRLHVKIPLAQVFTSPTVRELASYINDSGTYAFAPITAVEKREYYLLSPAQKRLFFLQQMDAHTAYNLTEAWTISGNFDSHRFETVLKQLIRRHESLRTSFEVIDGEPVQIVHDSVPFEIETFDPGQVLHFVRVFDLSLAPLMRVGRAGLGKDKHLLLFDMHHIVSDGVSMAVLAGDFISLYVGKELSPLPVQYKDFVLWLTALYDSREMEEQESYWLKQFEGNIPVLKLFTDYPRPDTQSFAGDVLHFPLQRELALELRELAAAGETTLFVLLLAAFYILLARFIEQEDILVGTPAAGRKHADLNRIIGMFVNTLVLRNRPGSNKIFSAFLREVRQSVLAAFENQDYPLERLINRLQVPKIPGRNPLFDILFVSENTDIPRLELENLEMLPYKMEHRISHLDLVIYVVEEGDDVTIALEYATDLYKSDSIRRFGEYYIEILGQLKEKASRPLVEIKISHEFEKAKSVLQAERADPFNF